MLKEEKDTAARPNNESNESFASDLIDSSRDILEQLNEVHGDATGVLIEIYQSHPDTLSLEYINTISQRYGRHALQLIENFGEETPVLEAEFRTLLESFRGEPDKYSSALYCYAGKEALRSLTDDSLVDRFTHLSLEDKHAMLMAEHARPLLSQHASTIVDWYARHGSLGHSLHIRAINDGVASVADFADAQRKILRRLMQPGKEKARLGFSSVLESSSITLSDIAQYSARIVDVAGRYGTAITPWFKAKGEKLFPVERKARKTLEAIQEQFTEDWIDEYLGKTFASIPSTALLQYPEDIQFIARRCKDYAVAIFGVLEDVPDTLDYDAEVLIDIIDSQGVNAFGAVRSFIYHVPDTIKENVEFCRDLVEYSGDELKTVFDEFPWPLLPEQQEEFLKLLKRFGPLMGPLLEQFGDDCIDACNKHADSLETIQTLFGEQAPLFLRVVEVHEWTDAQSYYDRHGSAAPSILEYYGSLYDSIETTTGLEDFRTLRQQARQTLGIRHIERFARLQVILEGSETDDMALEYSLLEKVVHNLDPQHNADKPIVLAVYSEADHNGALNCEFEYEALMELSEHYKVLIVEAETKEELDQRIQTIGGLHGLDPVGNALKPIDIILFSGHGSRSGISLGDDSAHAGTETDSYRLSTQDRNLIRSWSPYIRSTGIVAFSACRVGVGGLDSDNLARSWHDCFPEMDLDAAGQSCTFDGLLTNEKNEFQGLHFESIAEHRVLRIRQGQRVFHRPDIYGNDEFTPTQ